MNDLIPLSYNPIPLESYYTTLQQYAERPHTCMIDDFEKKIAEITRAKYVVALNSGTASLHLGLKVLGVKEGDEVIVSTFTYVGSVNPIIYLGAKPVFVDSEPITGNMDPLLLEQAILDCKSRGKKPKAIVVVHSYGMPSQMDEIMAIAKHFEIPLLEDAAESLGSQYKGNHLGTLGTIGVLSFNNNKIVTTYGGGAILTNDEKFYHKALYWASQARENKSYYEFNEVGFSYRMGSVNAAAGLASLRLYPTQIEASRTVHNRYKKEMADVEGINFISEPSGYYSNNWLSTAYIDEGFGKTSASLAAFLQSHDVETRPVWNPMHQQPVFKSFAHFGNGVSDNFFKTGICLPSGLNLSIINQMKVVDLIFRHFK